MAWLEEGTARSSQSKGTLAAVKGKPVFPLFEEGTIGPAFMLLAGASTGGVAICPEDPGAHAILPERMPLFICIAF